MSFSADNLYFPTYCHCNAHNIPSPETPFPILHTAFHIPQSALPPHVCRTENPPVPLSKFADGTHESHPLRGTNSKYH